MEVLDVGVVQLQMKKITHMLLMFDFIDYCNLYHVCIPHVCMCCFIKILWVQVSGQNRF